MKRDSFSTYHPALNLIFFCFVLGVNMFVMHPVFLGISLIASTVYESLLSGTRVAIKNFMFFSLPIMIIVALINPMFNHYGVTVLFYLKNGNAITLESMVYGLVMAMMLCGVLATFRCINKVMTTDKLVFLFGRILPAFSLIFSMVMRFVPEFSKRQKVISEGQKGIGRDVSNGNFLQKTKNGITILSILITWSLERAIDTADSMKARGYGLPGRTAFGIFKIDKRDIKLFIFMLLLVIGLLFGATKRMIYADYDPRIIISGWTDNKNGILMYVCYAAFCFIPVVLDIAEKIKWKRITGKVDESEQSSYRLWEA